MIDPVTATNDRLHENERWGYTSDLVEDSVPAPVDESPGARRWILWVAIVAIAVIVLIALFGGVV
jgi:hypothetical protein